MKAKCWLLLVAVLFVAVVSLVRPALADDMEKVVGVWKLVSVVYEDAETKARTPAGARRASEGLSDCHTRGALARTGDR
jgi:hypothetical protein